MSLSPGNFYQYPHNVPLEVASETGLIGFLIVFGPLVAGWLMLLWSGIKRASPATAGVMMIVTVFFTTANLSGDIPSDRGLWIFGILAFKFGVDSNIEKIFLTNDFDDRLEGFDTERYVPCLRTDDLVFRLHDPDVRRSDVSVPGDRALLRLERKRVQDLHGAQLDPASHTGNQLCSGHLQCCSRR